MYYPIQIPYLLDKNYSKYILYSEEVADSLQGFVICFWQSLSLVVDKASLNETIIIDGCIDLVVDYDNKTIGFGGFSKSIFDFKVDLPSRFFGARLKPGAFYQLTKIPAIEVMDNFLPLEKVDKYFETEFFWSLTFEESKEFFKSYLKNLIVNKIPNQYTLLFDELVQKLPITTAELYQYLSLTPRTVNGHF